MAHAIVDGLTPAHHFPYAEKIKELRGGQAHSDRSSVKEKLLIPGATLRLQFSNNWKFWGPKGLLITHAAFEYGVATVLKTFSIKEPLAAIESSSLITENNLGQWYRETAQKIYKLAIYDRFYESGWNRALIKDVRQQLLPLIINSVTLSWYGAIHTANLKS